MLCRMCGGKEKYRESSGEKPDLKRSIGRLWQTLKWLVMKEIGRMWNGLICLGIGRFGEPL